MGTVSGPNISKAARRLLADLARDGSVLYSRYYDGTAETEARLAAELSVDAGWTPPAVLFDLAVFHLENENLVERADTDGRLDDGEPDYRITLTPRGRKFVARGVDFECPHTEL
jgi:hypothetical protein